MIRPFVQSRFVVEIPPGEAVTVWGLRDTILQRASITSHVFKVRVSNR